MTGSELLSSLFGGFFLEVVKVIDGVLFLLND